MPDRSTFVIVGAGMAAALAAEELRERGFDGRLVMIGDETEPPYERPPLSKDYLRGETAEPPFVHPRAFYEEREIELWSGSRVEAIDVVGREVVVAGGRRVSFGRLLLATGAEPRRLRVPGAELDGIHYLRTLGDSQQIARRLERRERLVVVGSGWIGAEIAASARQRGCEVTMIEMATLPLERVLGPELGQIYVDVHRDHGVEFIGETTVERFEGAGRVERVVTRDGAELDVDFVVVGVGVAPRTEVAEAAGIAVEDGILTDERLETRVPGIFAAGDVANAFNPFYGRRIRVEHWANARGQGAAAARAMLGEPVSYDAIPYFFSDQYEVGMEYAGFATSWDRIVFRGDVKGREFIAFWLQGGRVVAGMNVNVWDVNERIRELIHSRRLVDERQLADPGVSLAELAGAAAGAAG